MRYRKSIRLAKGLRINVSKSGLSLTAGIPGLSMNVGKQGTFLNTGIPGTGLYDRKRISGSTRSTGQRSQASGSGGVTTISLDVTLDNKGNPVLSYADGSVLTDSSLINRIKRTPEYKAQISQLVQERKDQIDQATEQFIHSYRLSPQLIEENSIRLQLKNLKPTTYQPEPYQVKPPTEEEVHKYLEIEAKLQVRTWKVWKLASLRAQYVQDQLHQRLGQDQRAYEQAKCNHDQEEQQKKQKLDSRYLAQYDQEKVHLENWLSGPGNWVEQEVENLISSISLPVDFAVDFEYDQSKGLLKIDLDLPEVEDLPQTKARILSTGKLSVKEKSKKDLAQDYATCIAGLPFFFASHLFNLSGAINQILVSGYTQRLDSSIGKITDQYVISVLFLRDTFGGLNLQSIDPILALGNFTHKFDQDRSGNLKTIEPLE